MNRERQKELFYLYKEQKLTEKEEKELLYFLYKLSDDELGSLVEDLCDTYPVTDHMNADDASRIFKNVINSRRGYRVNPFVKAAAAIAASVIISLTGYYSGFFDFVKDKDTIAVLQDFTPGGEKATLTLANGSIVRLDNSKDSIIAINSADVKVKIQNNQLIYNSLPMAQEAALKFNTLSTPHGGEYRMQLPDGTNVWLNAESSISFPNTFASNERRVKITGEVYFEVSKTTDKKPFFVEISDKAVVEVLGTHFNINAYENEGGIRTTLVEGSVRVQSELSKQSQVINPGQQALITDKGSMSVLEVEANDIIAWTKGKFMFEKADIHTIMRQLERWYDIKVVYEDSIEQHLGGSISRGVNLSKIFDMLELTGIVRFSTDNDMVRVLANENEKREVN